MLPKTIVNTIRKLDDFVYSFGSIRVLFVVRNNLGMLCFKPIIEEMNKRTNFKIAITVETANCYSPPKSMEALFNKYYIPTGNATNKKWHFVFTTDWTDLWFKRNMTLIYTRHGNAYGNSDIKADSTYYNKNLVMKGYHNIYFTNSPGDCADTEQWINKSSKSNIKKSFITGLARSDKLAVSKKEDGKSFLKEYGLCQTKRNIVIGSHWPDKSLFRTLGVEFINTLCKEYQDANIIVTGHGNLWRDELDNLLNRMNVVADKNDNCYFFPVLAENIGLLRSADIFIGDNSSFFVEFCIVDKPILFFDNPDFIFGDKQVGCLYKKASTPFSTEAELLTEIDKVMTMPDLLCNHRKQVVDHFLANIGHASETVVNTTESLGKNYRGAR